METLVGGACASRSRIADAGDMPEMEPWQRQLDAGGRRAAAAPLKLRPDA